MKIENKTVGGNIVEYKQEDRNGVPVGIVAGYIATWDLDRVDDRFVRGAFLDSIADHRSKGRPIRLKDHHGRTVGGFPIESVREDDRGLFGVGEINLEVQQGREAFLLAKQGVLSDFSIGFSIVDFRMEDGIRVIEKASVWEGSIVDEPANPSANITEVKSVTSFKDLTIDGTGAQWDKDSAEDRVKGFCCESEYRNAFVFIGEKHNLQIADVVNEKLVVIPEAVKQAARSIMNGGLDISESEKSQVIKHLERYYSKMDIRSPFSEKQFFDLDAVKSWGKREIEEGLIKTGAFSKKAAKTLASKLDKIETIDQTPDQRKETGISDDLAKSLLKEISFLKAKIA